MSPRIALPRGRKAGYAEPPEERRCKAKCKARGERCRNWGVEGSTPQVCHKHGGAAWSKAEKRWLGGKDAVRGPRADRYDGAVRALPRLAKAAEEIDRDPDVEDTRQEIKLLRTLLVAQLHQLGEGVLAVDVLPDLVEHVDRISRVVERHHRQTHGVGVQITVRDWMALADKFLGVAEEFFALQDPERWALFLQNIQHLLRTERDHAAPPALPRPALDAEFREMAP